MLTQKRVRELFEYNPKTGLLTRKTHLNRWNIIGSIAGSKTSSGHIAIGIDMKVYQAHRVIWLWVKGYLPEGLVEHRDQIKHHNWWSNLREASNQCNRRNTKNPRNNNSGIKGVRWNKKDKCWRATIGVDNKNIHVHSGKDFDEAVAHRLAAEQCLNWQDCDSSSPAYKQLRRWIK